MPGIRRGTATWKTDVATPPILASMTKQPKNKKRKRQGKPPTWVNSITHVGEKKPAEETSQFE